MGGAQHIAAWVIGIFDHLAVVVGDGGEATEVVVGVGGGVGEGR